MVIAVEECIFDLLLLRFWGTGRGVGVVRLGDSLGVVFESRLAEYDDQLRT